MSQCFLKKRGKSRPIFVSVQAIAKIFLKIHLRSFHPAPILRPVKRPEVSSYDKCVRIAFFEPDLAAVPLPFFGVEDVAGLPKTVFQHHIDQNDHVQHRLVFAVAGAFVAKPVGTLAQEFYDFAVQFAAGLVNFDVAFFFIGFVIFCFPGAEDVLRLAATK